MNTSQIVLALDNERIVALLKAHAALIPPERLRVFIVGDHAPAFAPISTALVCSGRPSMKSVDGQRTLYLLTHEQAGQLFRATRVRADFVAEVEAVMPAGKVRVVTLLGGECRSNDASLSNLLNEPPLSVEDRRYLAVLLSAPTLSEDTDGSL